ncbi:MAG TPA: adenylate/guanylate cyclase domain-containing protein [Anaerolineales bacterium]
MDETTQLTETIAALEAQRALLGDAVVDTALAPLRQKLASLQGQPAGEQRKLVTVLFADLVGFTALSTGMDPEDMREIVNAYFKRWAVCIEKYGGVVEKYIGDAVMAVFGLSVSQEDDPERAIRAALEMRQSLSGLNEDLNSAWGVQLAMRVGIHTGPVMVSLLGERKGQEFVVVGDTVNLASRIQGFAPSGGILISHDTSRHVRGVFDLQALDPTQVKGKSGPVQAYLVLQARPRAFRMATRGLEGIETPIIGRQAELDRLKGTLDQVLKEHKARVVTVVGDAGIGKTRLMAEFDDWIEQVPQVIRYFKGRAGPSMLNLPYSLLRDLFSFRFQISESDSPQALQEKIEAGIGEFEYGGLPDEARMRAHFIGQLLGYKFENSPYLQGSQNDPRLNHERALSYLVDYFCRLAEIRPIAILLEDIHWADDSSLETLEQLVAALPGQAMMMVCAARPTLYERRPQWGTANDDIYQRLDLSPLTRRDSQRLVKEILKKAENLPAALQALIVDRAEGNPFFTEELIKMLIEDGVILKEGDHWRVNPAQLAGLRVPPTLAGVLQARFDSLTLEERVLLQRASVVGRIFWDEAVGSMEGGPVGDQLALQPQIEQILQRLSAREMIFPNRDSAFDDTAEYHFKHALLRDVTYESVLKRLRRIYHALAAAWLEAETRRSRRSEEYAALIAGHYDQAEEWQPARTWYLKAGIQAADQYASAEAIRCFSRCLELWPEQDLAGQMDVYIRRARLYDLTADRAAQKSDLEKLLALAEAFEKQPGLPGESASPQNKAGYSWPARAHIQWWYYHEALGDAQAAIADAEKVVAYSRAAGDLEAEALGYLHLGASNWKTSDFPTARTVLEQGVALARQAQKPSIEADCLRNLGVVSEYLEEYAKAKDQYDAAQKIYEETGNERGQSMVLNSIGSLLVEQRLYRQAQSYFEQSLVLKRKVGHRRAEHITLENLGNVADKLGRYGEARQYLEQVLRFATEGGDQEGVADALLVLSSVSMHLGDFERAQTELSRSQAVFREAGIRFSECEGLLLQGLIALAQGDPQAALQHGQEALRLGQELKMQRELSHARLIVGRALVGLGRAAAAQETFVEALQGSLELWDAGLILACRAGLALAYRLGGSHELAVQAIQPVLAYLYPPDRASSGEMPLEVLDGLEEPLWVLLACSQILETAGDPRAAHLLDAAGRLVQARLSLIDDEAMRSAYLAIPIHREISERR